MKKILFSAAVALIGFNAFAYDPVSLLKVSNGVKSFVQTDYTVTSKFGEYYRTPESKFQNTLNAKGQIIENTELSNDGKLINKIASSYGSNGHIISKICYDENSKILWKITYTYDNGLLTEESEFDGNDILINKTLYKYNGINLIDATLYNAQGSIVWKTTYNYNERNLPETENSYYDTGLQESKKVYKYDENHKIHEVFFYNDQNKQIKRELYRYSDNGDVTEITTYDEENAISYRLLLKYDINGNLAKMTNYHISKKFGTTVNELLSMTEYIYQY